MDAQSHNAANASLSDEFSRALDEQLRASEAFLAEHEERLHDTLSELGKQLQSMTEVFDLSQLELLRERCLAAEQEADRLRQRCDELQKHGRRSERKGESGSVRSFNWENQKKRLMASLDDTEGEAAERLTLDGAIGITDAMLNEKDAQIESLQRQLDELQARHSGETARQELLNADEVVREERRRLAELQSEFKEKQRLAEVEISMERAKLARARVELEEQRTTLRSQHGEPNDSDAAAQPPRKATRGRWLARLGLKDADDDSGS